MAWVTLHKAEERPSPAMSHHVTSLLLLYLSPTALSKNHRHVLGLLDSH